MKNTLVIGMLATILKYQHDVNSDDLASALKEQISHYFDCSTGNKLNDIHSLTLELLKFHSEMVNQNPIVKETIIKAIDDYFIHDNVRLQERLNAIEEKGALETEHVNAKNDLEAYQKAGVSRNINSPQELTLSVVRDAETQLGLHVTYNPVKWADPVGENDNPHPEIGNPVFDPRAKMNPKTPGFTFDPQYGRPLIERETGVKNRNGERKILLEEAGPHKGRPINPIGKTGITGRGLLGKFGPNSAADALVRRLNLTTGLIEIIVIFRKNEKQWAIPGGMVDPAELASKTACREFTEEAGNIPLGNLPLFIEKLLMWIRLFNPNLVSELESIFQILEQKMQSLAIAEQVQQKFKERSLAHKVLANLDFNHFHELVTGSEENLVNFINNLVEAKIISEEQVLEARTIFQKISPDEFSAMLVIKSIVDKVKKIYEKSFVKVILGCNKAVEVYKGYVDDPRNTDHAWMETSAYAWEIGNFNPIEEEILHLCESGDDTTKRDMVDPIANKLFANHSAIAAKMIVGEIPRNALLLGTEQLANFLTQRAAAAELLIRWPAFP